MIFSVRRSESDLIGLVDCNTFLNDKYAFAVAKNTVLFNLMTENSLKIKFFKDRFKSEMFLWSDAAFEALKELRDRFLYFVEFDPGKFSQFLNPVLIDRLCYLFKLDPVVCCCRKIDSQFRYDAYFLDLQWVAAFAEFYKAYAPDKY